MDNHNYLMEILGDAFAPTNDSTSMSDVSGLDDSSSVPATPALSLLDSPFVPVVVPPSPVATMKLHGEVKSARHKMVRAEPGAVTINKNDRRVKVYERDLGSPAVEQARHEAEGKTQAYADSFRDSTGVRRKKRVRVTVEEGEDLEEARKDRRRELNQNSAKVARKRGQYYQEVLEDKVVELEKRLEEVQEELKTLKAQQGALHNKMMDLNGLSTLGLVQMNPAA